MKLLLSIILYASLAFGQSATTPPDPTGFVAFGSGWNPYTNPQVNGWASYAYLIDAKSSLWLYTTEDITSASKHPFTIQTSIRTGLATPIKTWGRLQIIALADGGMASSTLNNGAAASFGTIDMFRITKSWYIVAGFRMIKVQGVDGTPKLYEFGMGHSF